MSAILGARGLFTSSGGNTPAPPVNPYLAIAGLNSWFPADATHLVKDPNTGIGVAVQSTSATTPVPYEYQPNPMVQPVIGAIAGRASWTFTSGGAGAFLMAPDATADIVGDNDSVTVFAVVQTSVAGIGAGIYGKSFGSTRWNLSLDNGGFGKALWSINGFSGFIPTLATIASDASIADGNPHRLICVYDPAADPGDTISMYVDGVLQAATANVVGPLAGSTDRVGLGALVGFGGGAAAYLDGLVGDPGSYARALSPSEVAALDAIMAARF